MRKWRVEDSAELYNIGGWGREYFSVNEKGNMTVTPRQGVAPVDIREVLGSLSL
jgi:arginine decarboxylase